MNNERKYTHEEQIKNPNLPPPKPKPNEVESLHYEETYSHITSDKDDAEFLRELDEFIKRNKDFFK